MVFVEGEVRRLLEGRAELSELAMTGGLWRVSARMGERFSICTFSSAFSAQLELVQQSRAQCERMSKERFRSGR